MPTTDPTVTETQSLPQFLSEADLANFRDDGYLIVRSSVPDAIREEMLRVTTDHLAHVVTPVEFEADLSYPGAPDSRDANGGDTVRRLRLAHSRHPVFTEWVCEPQIHFLLSQIMEHVQLGDARRKRPDGPSHLVMPLAHHNCVMTKMPNFSSETGWHRDIRYWSFERRELVSAWIALGAENTNNGCLYLIPGSHRMEIGRERFDEMQFLRSDHPDNREIIGKAIPAELEPGDILFFHCATLHSAGQNTTDKPKFSAVFTFRHFDNPPIPGTRSSSLPELLLPAV